MIKGGIRISITLFLIGIFFVAAFPIYAAPKKEKINPHILQQIEETVKAQQTATPSPSASAAPRASSLPQVIDTLPQAKETEAQAQIATQDAVKDISSKSTENQEKIYARWFDGKVQVWKDNSGQLLLSIRPLSFVLLPLIVLFLAIFLVKLLFKMIALKKAADEKAYKIRRIEL